MSISGLVKMSYFGFRARPTDVPQMLMRKGPHVVLSATIVCMWHPSNIAPPKTSHRHALMPSGSSVSEPSAPSSASDAMPALLGFQVLPAMLLERQDQ